MCKLNWGNLNKIGRLCQRQPPGCDIKLQFRTMLPLGEIRQNVHTHFVLFHITAYKFTNIAMKF